MPLPIGAPVPSARPVGTHAGADIRRPSLDEGAADTGAHHAPKAPSPHRADAPASSGGGSGTISSTNQRGSSWNRNVWAFPTTTVSYTHLTLPTIA